MSGFRPALAGLATTAQTRGDTAGERGLVRSVCTPVQAIAQPEVASCLGRLLGYPHGHDVVLSLIVGGQLNKLYRTGSPILQRLYPEARAAIVMYAIEIVVEV